MEKVESRGRKTDIKGLKPRGAVRGERGNSWVRRILTGMSLLHDEQLRGLHNTSADLKPSKVKTADSLLFYWSLNNFDKLIMVFK